MNRHTLLLLCLVLFQGLQAQTDSSLESASAMVQNGKIYVVITVIAVIFVSLAGFLVYLERRISKMEKKINSGENAGAVDNQPRH